MKQIKILFLHGLGSVPGGIKATYLKSKGYEVLNPALPDASFEESCDIAQALVQGEEPHIIIGSSRGGAVAMSINPGSAKMILMAPAWTRFLNEEREISRDTFVLHSPNDDIVSISDSETLAMKYDLKLIQCGKEHRMSDDEALEVMHNVVKSFS